MKKLKAEYPDIEFHQMVFFDNEIGNIRNVSQLGVHSVFCPDGMTREIWNRGLADFVKNQE